MMWGWQPATRGAIAGLFFAIASQALAIANPAPTISPTDTEAETAPAEPQYLRPRTPCPTDLDTLVAGLLRDLPSYANRVARRTTQANGTILVAGRADLAPLDPAQSVLSGGDAFDDTLPQVFFTTLERRYTATGSVNFEQYHWLFLTPAQNGWRLVLMFSRTAVDGPRSRPPTPPQESSDGVVGQAVRLWLRDCRAAAVDPIKPTGGGEEGGSEESEGDTAVPISR